MDFCIIITGRDKRPEILQKSSNIYKELLKEGFVKQVIYSTGKGCMPEFIRSNCKDFHLSETEEPILECRRPNGNLCKLHNGRGIGNCWVQTQQLEHGLSLIDDPQHALVLKTRPDVLISKDLIKKVFKSIEEMKVGCEKTGLLNKVWNPWFDLSKPFYMADECFAGRATDLQKFINYRFIEYPRRFQGITHVRRTVEPFLNTFPALMDYILAKDDSKHIYALTSRKRARSILNGLETESYRQYLAAYYFILNKYFFIYNPLPEIDFRVWSQNVNNQIIPDLNIQTNIEKVPFLINTFHLGYNEKFIQNINSGFFKDEISQDIYNRIKNYSL
jgi:hypothetical protein